MDILAQALSFVFGGNSLYNGQVQVVVQLVGLGPARSATYRFRLERSESLQLLCELKHRSQDSESESIQK